MPEMVRVKEIAGIDVPRGLIRAEGGPRYRRRYLVVALPAAAAHKVHHFQPIVLAEDGLGPQVAANDLAIKFRGDAIGFHPKLLHQLGERERSRELTFIAVQDYLHL